MHSNFQKCLAVLDRTQSIICISPLLLVAMEYNRAMQAALELSMLNLNNTSYSMTSPEPPYGLLEDEVPIDSLKTKSQNITQCVSVPTSEHVAEIVGRQGGSNGCSLG